MILTTIFALWALGAYLLTSNEVMKKVRDSHPMNLFSPAKGAAMIFLCLVVFAPAVFLIRSVTVAWVTGG